MGNVSRLSLNDSHGRWSRGLPLVAGTWLRGGPGWCRVARSAKAVPKELGCCCGFICLPLKTVRSDFIPLLTAGCLLALETGQLGEGPSFQGQQSSTCQSIRIQKTKDMVMQSSAHRLAGPMLFPPSTYHVTNMQFSHEIII